MKKFRVFTQDNKMYYINDINATMAALKAEDILERVNSDRSSKVIKVEEVF